MRLAEATGSWIALAVIVGLLLAPNARSADPERKLDDILGTLVVEATPPAKLGKHLIRVAVEPSLSPSEADVLAHAIVQRDLVLSGEVQLLAESSAPSGAYTSKAAPELDRWRKTGVQALIRIGSTMTGGSDLRLRASVYLLDDESVPVMRRTVSGTRAHRRLAAHRLSDAIIGVLTGYDGGFASRMAFVVTAGRKRRAFVIDADGHGARRSSGGHDLVSMTAFKAHQVLYAASVRHGAYRLYQAGARTSLSVIPNGSIYGAAFSPDGAYAALAIATERTVAIFTGPSQPLRLKRTSTTEMALSPAFSPTGKLAYVGINGNLHRIYVDGHPVSPPGLMASAPVFCAHPNGTRLIYTVRSSQRFDLVMSDDNGKSPRRLTGGPGSNTYPACSPDGRLVAFFSTRTSHEGPGLYIMPIDGGRPRRISSLVGGSLVWARLPDEIQ